MPTLLRIAFRNLVGNRTKTLIIGIIIALGAAVVALGGSLMETARLGLESTFVENFTGEVMLAGKVDGSISIFGVQSMNGSETTPVLLGYDEIIDRVRADPRVASVAPQVTGTGQATLDPGDPEGGTAIVYLFGIEPSSYRRTFDNLRIVDGAYLAPGVEGILLSTAQVEDIAEELGARVGVGDVLYIQNFGTSIRRVTIRGIFEWKRPSEALSMISYVDADTVRALSDLTIAAIAADPIDPESSALLGVAEPESELFRGPGAIVEAKDAASGDIEPAAVAAARVDSNAWSYLLVRLQNDADAGGFMADMNAWFRSEGVEAEAYAWESAAGPFATIPNMIGAVAIFGAVVVGLVAMIIIMNTIVVGVVERTSEIGTIRALGGRKLFVFELLFAEAGMTALAFGAAGVALGAALVAALNRSGLGSDNSFLQLLMGGPLLRPVVSLPSLAIAMLTALAAALVANLYPTAVALRLRPIQAIQAGRAE